MAAVVPYDGAVIVVMRFRREPDDAEWGDRLLAVVELFRSLPGFDDATVGRNVDDPRLWTLVTRWRNVGSYRRALSAYPVKLHAVPVLSEAIDEPTAYELVEPGGELNLLGARSLN